MKTLCVLLLVGVVAGTSTLATGCRGTMITARYTRTPILLGPVKCIGCAPGANGLPTGQRLKASAMKMTHSGKRYYVEIRTSKTLLDRAVAGQVPFGDCTKDLHVSRIEASHLSPSFWVVMWNLHLINLYGKVHRIPGGRCVGPPPPGAAPPPGGAPLPSGAPPPASAKPSKVGKTS